MSNVPLQLGQPTDVGILQYSWSKAVHTVGCLLMYAVLGPREVSEFLTPYTKFVHAAQ